MHVIDLLFHVWGKYIFFFCFLNNQWTVNFVLIKDDLLYWYGNRFFHKWPPANTKTFSQCCCHVIDYIWRNIPILLRERLSSSSPISNLKTFWPEAKLSCRPLVCQSCLRMCIVLGYSAGYLVGCSGLGTPLSREAVIMGFPVRLPLRQQVVLAQSGFPP